MTGAVTTVLPAAGAATTQRLDAGPPPPVLPPAAPREPDRGGPSTLTWVITAVAVVALALLRRRGLDPRTEQAQVAR